MRNLFLVWAALALCACAVAPVPTPTPMPTPTSPSPTTIPTATRPAARDVFETNKRLGRGMNIGNALEGPREGAWGVMIQDYYFPLIRKAGFDSVRLPIKWSAHADQTAPYTIDPEFMARIDTVVDQALKAGLAVVINIHHFEEMDKAPLDNRARLVGLWRQIANHFKNRPEDVVFEILNEPNTAQTAPLWNETLILPLKEIRASNPTRAVVVGGVNWNNVSTLATLALPADDRFLIGTFHYYNPFRFTHQGAEWVQGASEWNDTAWDGTPADLAAVRADFDLATTWGSQTKRPIYVGEFGAYNKAEMDARARWTAAVAREAEQRGFSWSYWEFASGFGAWSPGYGEWREPLLRALVPSAK